MDIDCDGNQKGPGNDGRCGPSQDTQSTTAFEDTIKGYNVGIQELNPYVHPYVVFGNDNENHKSGFVSFNPEDYGIKPLSVMAVVCGNKLVRPPFFFPSISNPILFYHFPLDSENRLSHLRSTVYGVTPTEPMAADRWWENPPFRSPPPAMAPASTATTGTKPPTCSTLPSRARAPFRVAQELSGMRSRTTSSSPASLVWVISS